MSKENYNDSIWARFESANPAGKITKAMAIERIGKCIASAPRGARQVLEGTSAEELFAVMEQGTHFGLDSLSIVGDKDPKYKRLIEELLEHPSINSMYSMMERARYDEIERRQAGINRDLEGILRKAGLTNVFNSQVLSETLVRSRSTVEGGSYTAPDCDSLGASLTKHSSVIRGTERSLTQRPPLNLNDEDMDGVRYLARMNSMAYMPDEACNLLAGIKNATEQIVRFLKAKMNEKGENDYETIAIALVLSIVQDYLPSN